MEHIGPYRIVHPIALGGMGEVYLAALTRSGGFEKQVAIKRALPELMCQPAFVQLFEQEARLAALLSHRNIVQIFDFGRDPDAGAWLAMEYVRGVDLKTVLDASSGAIPTPLAVEIAASCLRGLDYAHVRSTDPQGRPLGLVHRDVTPHNILLSYQGDVKLTDFGLARATAAGGEPRAGIRGKFGYMSPEQAAGEVVDARSDLYAVGVVLYEMLTGQRAFWANDGVEAILDRARRGATLAPVAEAAPNLHPALIRVVERAMGRGRDERYASAESFRLALLEAGRVAGAAPGTIELGEWLLGRFPPRELSGPFTEAVERTATAASPIAVVSDPPAEASTEAVVDAPTSDLPVAEVSKPVRWRSSVVAGVTALGLIAALGWAFTDTPSRPSSSGSVIASRALPDAELAVEYDAGSAILDLGLAIPPDAFQTKADAQRDAAVVGPDQGRPRAVITPMRKRPRRVARLPRSALAAAVKAVKAVKAARMPRPDPVASPVDAGTTPDMGAPAAPRPSAVPSEALARVRLVAVGAKLRAGGPVRDGWRVVPKRGLMVRVEGGAGPATKVRLISRGSHFEALIHSKPFGTVFVDGRNFGPTPAAIVPLSPGNRRLEIIGADGKRTRLDLEVAP